MTVSSEDLDSCALLSLRLEGDLWDAGAERSALMMMMISKNHGFLYNLLVTWEDHVLVLRRRCVSNEPPQAFTAAVARCPDLESLFKSMHLKTSPEKALQHLHLCFVPCFSSFHTDGVY